MHCERVFVSLNIFANVLYVALVRHSAKTIVKFVLYYFA
mgnify:CR=1 FL=1